MWARKESTLETFDRVIMARFLGTGGRGWDGWVVGRKGEVFFQAARIVAYSIPDKK